MVAGFQQRVNDLAAVDAENRTGSPGGSQQNGAGMLRCRTGSGKPGSHFINIARGGIVVDEALKDAVLSGHLAGAAVDAFRKEPCTDSPLAGVPGIVLTPHTAPYTQENFGELNIIAVQNVLDFLGDKLDDKYRLT